LVERDGFRLLLDLGNGALGPLASFADLREIDAVLVSHLHADHCIDLTSAYVARRYGPGPMPPPLSVYGPAGTAARIARAYAADGRARLDRVFQFRDYGDPQEVINLGPFQVTTTVVVHPVTCHAIRLTAGGRSLVYSGDTGPTPILVDFARGADVALFEASELAGRPMADGLHLRADETAQHARDAGVERLVMTHLVPWVDPRKLYAQGRAVFGAGTLLARTGLVVDV
jgi:ribonuclease BN (tRNA processing enzyme)